VGSDLPDITPSLIHEAIAVLKSDPKTLVLGPAQDGGYYLIAATSVPDVFEGVEWGSARLLEQTRAAAAANGLRGQLLDPLYDVDTPEDLQKVQGRRTRA
jgi:glycosyltransferase A (GT-A) superfamily protein (DUF2064 family)